MSKINYQVLRMAAENATPGEWCSDDYYRVIADAGLNANYYTASCSGPDNRANKRFIAAANPATVLALLDELEAAKKRIAELEAREIKPEDELSNIVLFPAKEDDPRNQVNFLYEPSERPYCHHASVRVDEKERQVRCKICGAVVEPFDWMLSVAKRETGLADDVRLLRQEERERRRNIEKLIQIERNAKARIRRATKSRTE